jgi:hypothetical protein
MALFPLPQSLNLHFSQFVLLVVSVWCVCTPAYLAMCHFGLGSKSQLIVGFSAILFALSSYDSLVIMIDGDGGWKYLIAPLWTAIVIQIRVPNASFLGHLSGIVAGFIVWMCKTAIQTYVMISVADFFIIVVVALAVFIGIGFWFRSVREQRKRVVLDY